MAKDYNEQDSLFLLLQAVYLTAVKDITNKKEICPNCDDHLPHKVNACAIQFVLALRYELYNIPEISGIDVANFMLEVWNGNYR